MGVPQRLPPPPRRRTKGHSLGAVMSWFGRPILFTKDGWNSAPRSLGAPPEMECTGDMCVPIVAHLDKTGAQTFSDAIARAQAQAPECFSSAGDSDLLGAVQTKLSSILTGQVSTVGLTKDQKNYLDAVLSCAGPAPISAPASGAAAAAAAIPSAAASAAPVSDTGTMNTLVVAAAGMVVIGIFVALVRS